MTGRTPPGTAATAWREWLSLALVLIALGSLTLTLFRFLLWWDYRPVSPLPAGDLVRAFGLGLRFDLKALGFFALLSTILMIVPIVLARWRPVAKVKQWLQLALVALVLAAVDLLALINHFYVDFYGTEINAIIFGLFEDDTAGVLASVWNNFPVLWLALAWLVMATAQTAVTLWAGRRLAAATLGWPNALRASYSVLALLLIIILVRGSVTRFPLREMHLTFARDDFINMLVPNGPFALRVAYKERQRDRIRHNPDEGLDQLGFENALEAARAYGLPAGTEQEIEAALYRRTARNASLEAHRPHVVVALMEAFGTHVMDYHRPTNDVLGRFARHAKEDWLFRNFVAINHGTHPTLEGLLFNSPISPLTSAGHGFYTLSTSAVLPYKSAGYHTVFLSSGPANWRGLDGVLRRQGFDEVIDDTVLQQHYPEAEATTWGVADEFMFRYALELLASADRRGQRLFLFMLSTSNHTPYETPAHYQPGPLDLGLFEPLALARPSELRALLETYQYSADALGEFLDQLKDSPLAGRSIVAATGDHSTRHFVKYESDYELLHEYGVPLYLYVPPRYRDGSRFDAQRFGGHRDLFPTLYAHSLSGACHFASGDNLLGPGGSQTALAAFEYALTAEGVVGNLKRPVFRRWSQPYSRLETKPLPQPTEALAQVAGRERGYVAVLDWHIRRQVLAKQSRQPRCAP